MTRLLAQHHRALAERLRRLPNGKPPHPAFGHPLPDGARGTKNRGAFPIFPSPRRGEGQGEGVGVVVLIEKFRN